MNKKPTNEAEQPPEVLSSDIRELLKSIPLDEVLAFVKEKEEDFERSSESQTPVDQPDTQLVEQICDLKKKRSILLEQLVNENKPLLRGALNKKLRKCGKKNCKCTRGELHKSFQLSARVDGRTHTRHIPASDLPIVAPAAKRYKAWKNNRAEIVRLNKEQLQLIDKRRDELLRSYPNDQPFPPPKSWK